MRKLLPLILLLLSITIKAQIPSYYNDVNMNLNGQALQDELATKIISTHHTFLSYTPGVWDALKQTDIDPTNPNNVVLIYGWNDSDSDITNDRTRNKDQHGSGSGVWNREHVFSKSLAEPNLGTTGPGADAHNLRPCDAQRNSSRSNRKFAAGSGIPSYITPEGYWYPGDEWKGDVARMMMYMYLRYGNQTLPINVGVGTTVATDPNMIELFLQWNAEDPVSELEKQRNPVLETQQGNRNPFIDNPAFATKIWGGPQAEDLFGTGGGSNDTQAPSNPSGLIASNVTSSTVDLAWTASTDNVGVSGYLVFNGTTQIGSTSSTSFTANGLTAGTSYTFYVRAYDAAANTSGNSNGVSVTTTSGGGTGGLGSASELLISEYVEGSSYNKAIEIANFTGSTIDLSAYSLRKVTNGGGSFSSTLNLSGQLANGQVYVVANSNANATITSTANITENSVTTFNGNDAVGLFKNGSIIDLIGNPNSSATFGQDVTLRRKSSVTSPNTSYTTIEWDTFAGDTFSGLGSHTMDTAAADTTAPTTPSGLVSSNTTQTSTDLSWSASTDNVAVTGYDVYQGTTKIATITATSYSVTNLTANSTYNFSVRAFDEAGNVSTSSNSVTVTTLPEPSTNGDLIISEYIEGSSNNKAIEIANLSGATVDLSEYSLRKATNGGGTFSTILNLTGLLADGQVYVVANSNASTAILNVADITEASITTFNGNDAIGLFKNGVLLDLIGNPNSSANFAIDVTLQRNSSITTPNATYTTSEWDVLSTDNFSGLGNLVNGGGTSPTGPVVLAASYFETGMDNWTDGGGDVARYSGARSYEGTYSVRLRDNSGTASAMTSQSFDISSFDTVEVDFYFYAYSMENGEDFWLRFYNGSSWQTVQTWARGTDFNNNTFYNAKVTLNKANYNFASNARFRFQADASTNSDHIYIDQVTITGTSGVAARSTNVLASNSLTELNYLNTDEFDTFEGDFKMYPNPVSGQFLSIQLQDKEVENVTFTITSILGQVISTGNLEDNHINVGALKAGVYVLEIFDGEERMVQKFVKK